MQTDINRFLKAQEKDYETALLEIKSGRKRSHWMWYIFPQIKGLGHSETAIYYAINDLKEARAFLNHPLLGSRLIQITTELLHLKENNAHTIFGSPDNLKLKSCMTLFSAVDQAESNIFKQVIDKYFHGDLDSKTLNQLKE